MPQIDVETLRARLAEIDAEREPLVALITAAEIYEGVVGKTLFQSGSVRIRSRTRSGTGRAAPIMAATEQAVGEILEMLGPTSTATLVDVLSPKPELNLATENPSNILSARLSNSKKFVGRRGKGWWFADRPWPGEGESEQESSEEIEAPAATHTGWTTSASETAHTAQ